jgi:RNA polymerase-interacting CarD/CdnL/TRCF family regulator
MGSLLAARGALELATREKKSTQQKRKNNNNNKMKLGGLIDGAAIKGKTRTRMF